MAGTATLRPLYLRILPILLGLGLVMAIMAALAVMLMDYFWPLSQDLTYLTAILHYSLILLPLSLVAALLGMLVSRLLARDIGGSITALHRQVECLKGEDITACKIPQSTSTSETEALAGSLNELRQHMSDSWMDRKEVEKIRAFYRCMLTGLMVSLRQRISADSPILSELNDYALLMQIESQNPLPKPRAFDIKLLLDKVNEQARQAQSSTRIHLTASMQARMPREWSGYPEYLEALLRHLLLLSLRRTASGYVCLRLEAEPAKTGHGEDRLHISLDDSGPFIQPWQLQQWCGVDAETLHLSDIQDFSWLMTSHIFSYLEGRVLALSPPEGGLSLKGWIPFAILKSGSITPSARHAASAGNPPLVIAVEPDREARNATMQIFTRCGYRIFLVENHLELLQWAPLLPCCAIMLNASLPDVDGLAERIHQLFDAGAMQPVPLWASIANLSFIEFDEWRRRGVSELLLKPFQTDMLMRLAAEIKPLQDHFYQSFDQYLRDDLPPGAKESLSHMNAMLTSQLELMQPHLAALSNGELPEEAAASAHAVKSAALTLGYFRLAALMGETEHAIMSMRFSAFPQNWLLLQDCLRGVKF